MVQEVIIGVAAVILSISFVYYLLLRCAQNDWFGEIPPGPTKYPFLGSLWYYLGISDFIKEIEKNFILYGNIFTMKCHRQKVVFIYGLESIMPAVKEDQVENTTIRDFVQIFTTVQRKIKKREIVYLQNLWDLSFIQMLKVRDDDAALLKLIAQKIREEDEKIALENGLLQSTTSLSPCSSKTLLKSNSDIILEDGIEDEVFENLSEVLLERPLCWTSFFFQVFGGWRKNQIARSAVRKLLLQVQKYLNESLQTLNLKTEKRFLLIIYLLVKMSKMQSSTVQKSDMYLGPDLCGWRSFRCLEYAEIHHKYQVPKHSLIICKT